MEPSLEKSQVKLEIEDSLEEEYGPYNKRSKPSSPHSQLRTESYSFPVPPSQYNPLDEPSPLGLRLKKSPSLVDLIQMRLSQGNTSPKAVSGGNASSGEKKEVKTSTGLSTTDKLKASNFPASLLRIGCWEYVSRYEGDLVAKCYFAKHKLVWEVLDGGLKSKIEIQWSDIMALKANCPDNGPGTLNVVLARQPLFFRETNPQPRKHTLWQATADFTNGQASIHRQHFLQCPQGLLNKHFEKLIQCDMRLNFLSRQPDIVLDSPYFEQSSSVFDDPSESKGHEFDQIDNSNKGSATPPSNPAAQSSSVKIERRDLVGRGPDFSRESPSPSSVMDTHAIEGNTSSETEEFKGQRTWEQLKVPGLHPSISMGDLVNHIGHCISEQMNSVNPPFSHEQLQSNDMLDEIAQYLLSDSQFTSASDEQSLMARVNSLCCLLQKDPASVQNLQVDDEDSVRVDSVSELIDDHKDRGEDIRASEGDSKVPAMSRKDSYSDLLLHLPRITSLPKFLFNISEDEEDEAR